MNWTQLDTWIVVAGVLSAMACALPGTFLVLRRMSMMGDAISHAVLPGLAVAFLVTNSRGSVAMFIGAAVVGVLTAVFTQWLHGIGKVEQSAAMGVVFTAMFAIGLIIIVRAADKVDLDPGCVLYGAIELIPLDTMPLFGMAVPRAVVNLGVVFLLNAFIVCLFYKELRISAFDEALATTLGINARIMHYLVMTMVAVTAVAAFESVGSILVIAMLIVPAATAHLLTDRYGIMLLLSLVLGAAAAVLGHIGAITVPRLFGFADTSTAGMMAVASGLLFAMAMVFAPRYGVLSRGVHRIRLALRIAREDVLGLLFRLEEAGLVHRAAGITRLLRDALGRNLALSAAAMIGLRFRGRISRQDGTFRLTPTGRDDARRLVRAHRLWETYIAKHFDLPADHLHGSAERTEHYITSEMGARIADDVAGAELDPHGMPIPKER
ncbi:MAG: metal ABC transporter permease [Planctomycetes bacterium]|nr:metal ABC transporter permease [Planctomycetota bacterium]